mmetsp:Transcript_50913/g.99821  ORF Transcript_50913/g.99821 Transcript_50913/m.99821 type:complete len:330 (+) Transcript_50913:1437-2426(+)
MHVHVHLFLSFVTLGLYFFLLVVFCVFLGFIFIDEGQKSVKQLVPVLMAQILLDRTNHLTITLSDQSNDGLDLGLRQPGLIVQLLKDAKKEIFVHVRSIFHITFLVFCINLILLILIFIFFLVLVFIFCLVFIFIFIVFFVVFILIIFVILSCTAMLSSRVGLVSIHIVFIFILFFVELLICIELLIFITFISVSSCFGVQKLVYVFHQHLFIPCASELSKDGKTARVTSMNKSSKEVGIRNIEETTLNHALCMLQTPILHFDFHFLEVLCILVAFSFVPFSFVPFVLKIIVGTVAGLVLVFAIILAIILLVVGYSIFAVLPVVFIFIR